MQKRAIGAFSACALLLATGCATSGTVDKLEERVGALEQRFGEVERRAAAAESTAQRAAADAATAATASSATERRTEAMFNKTVTK